jgi:hypothetical protein
MLKFSILKCGAVMCAGALVFVLGSAVASASTLLDGTVLISNNAPDINTIYNNGVPVEASGPTTSTITLANSQYMFSFTADTITFYNPYPGSWGTAGPGLTFDGFVLQFSNVPTITSVVTEATSSRVPSDISVSNNAIYINFLGDLRSPGDISIFDVSFAPAATPLPAALPLFATGLGAMGLLGWRRKRKNTAAIAA